MKPTVKSSEDYFAAERLFTAEQARLAGVRGYSIDDFERNMRKAIKEGRECVNLCKISDK